MIYFSCFYINEDKEDEEDKEGEENDDKFVICLPAKVDIFGENFSAVKFEFLAGSS